MEKKLLGAGITLFSFVLLLVSNVVSANAVKDPCEKMKTGEFAEQNMIQIGLYISAVDIHALSYPLKNLHFMSAGVDCIESLENMNVGKGKYLISDNGRYIPFVCYEKIKNCVIIGRPPKVVNWLGKYI